MDAWNPMELALRSTHKGVGISDFLPSLSIHFTKTNYCGVRLMTKWLWSFVMLLTFAGVAGCGGEPAEEPAQPIPEAEIDENTEMGEIPDADTE